MPLSLGPIQCGGCMRSLDEPPSVPLEDRVPCHACGSIVRIYIAEMKATLIARTKLKLKHKRQGFRKPIYEQISGDDLHRNTGLWSYLLQQIDRLNNRYRKLVANAETGAILRFCDEPLDEHTDCGSARALRTRGPTNQGQVSKLFVAGDFEG